MNSRRLNILSYIIYIYICWLVRYVCDNRLLYLYYIYMHQNTVWNLELEIRLFKRGIINRSNMVPVYLYNTFHSSDSRSIQYYKTLQSRSKRNKWTERHIVVGATNSKCAWCSPSTQLFFDGYDLDTTRYLADISF